MRSEAQLMKIILDTAREDERIRAVVMNGSRLNPHARKDLFQDFDIVYYVTDPHPFRNNYSWIERFGELMILQEPEDMQDPPAENKGYFTYLMQFSDGNRIDLGIYPLEMRASVGRDSLSLTLLDKDNALPPLPPPDESSYLPAEPSAKAFADCCNEFWWVCPYVAKGLWRREFPYARFMLDQAVREQLMKMLTWQIGVQTGFRVNPGKYGKHFQQHLPAGQWRLLRKTYAGGGTASTWRALFAMGTLFRQAAGIVSKYNNFHYPEEHDRKVTAHLKHVRRLPRNAVEMY